MGGKAVIIGAGIAGLASAVRLRLKGYEVTVFEQNSYPGGKLTEFSINGYRFDAGPSLFTLPHHVDELFYLAGLEPGNFFTYQKQDESCRYFWNDGTRLTAWADQKHFFEEVSRVLGVSHSMLQRRLSNSKRKYELAGSIFMMQPIHRISTWLSPKVIPALLNIRKLNIFETMHHENEQWLKHNKLVQLFDRYATYNGSDPYRAPAILNMIPHLEHGIGAFLPTNGMHDITMSIYNLGLKLGVLFRFNEKVTGILVKNRKVHGVHTINGFSQADTIVVNMDVLPAYRLLLRDQPEPTRILSQERSSSALIFYWGIRRQFEELGLHNIFFSNDYQKEFADIFNGITPPADPTIYINITSKKVSGDAPPGCENWFVMVNVPQHTGQNWQELIPAFRKIIADKLSVILGVDILPLIDAEEILTPFDIEQKTSSYGGSLYGTSSNSRYAAFFRHPNRSGKLIGLYFCGGSVHPGGGIPLCLLSARIVDQLCPKP